MSYADFQFKQFSVSQRSCAMKVGTDGVLLGAWCDARKASSVLDVGAGCGLIALMVAQKNPTALIDAIEIDPAAAGEAALNFSRSPWAARLRVHNCDFLSYDTARRYDLIVSNPPFFEGGLAAPDQRRAMARHTATLPFGALLSQGANLLTDEGRISLIAPAEARESIEFLAGEANLWLSRRTAVRTTALKPAKRYLWEFSNVPASLEDGELVLMSNGEKTEEYASLTNDFYL